MQRLVYSQGIAETRTRNEAQKSSDETHQAWNAKQMQDWYMYLTIDIQGAEVPISDIVLAQLISLLVNV